MTDMNEEYKLTVNSEPVRVCETFYRAESILNTIASHMQIPPNFKGGIEELKGRIEAILPIILRDNIPTFMYLEAHIHLEDQTIFIDVWDSLSKIGRITVTL